MFDAGAIIGRLKLDKSGWDAAIKKIPKDQRTIGQKSALLGASLTKKLTVPLALMGLAAVKGFADFDKAMVESLAIMGNVSADLRKEMADTAKQLAGESVYSARELAQAYFYLASAGLDAEKSIGALPVVTKFAQAGTFDLSLATDLLTDAQSALGLTVDNTTQNMENMTRVSDVLVGANTLANATVQQFAEALTNRAAAALRGLNKDMEEGVAVLAAFADQGVKGREAGMQLAIVLTNMETAARMNEAEWEKLGVSLYDAEGNMVNIADVIGDLEGLLGGMSDKQKSATLAQLGFNERAIKTIKVLLGTSEKVRQYEKDIRSLGGITKEVSEKQMLSFTNQMTALKNEIVVVAVEFGEHLIPIIKKLVQDYVKPAVEWFKNLSDGQKETAVKVALFVAAAGPLLSIFGKFMAIIPSLIGLFGKLKLALIALTGPVGIVLAAATAAYLGINKLINKYKEKQDTEIEAIKTEGQMLADAMALRKQLIDNEILTVDEWREMWLKHGKDNKRVMVAIASHPAYAEIRKKIEGLKKATEDVTGASKDFGGVLEDDTIPAIEEAGEKTKTWIDYIKDLGIKTIKDKETRVRELEKYLGELDQAYKDGKISLEDYRTATKNATDEIKALSTTIIDTAIPAVRELPGVLDQAVGEMEGRYFDFKTQIGTDNDDIVKDLGTTTTEVKTLWEQLADGIQTKMASSFSDVLSGATSLKDGLKGIWDAMKKSFFDIAGSMLAKWTTDIIGGMVKSATTAATDVAASTASIGSAVSGIATGLAGLITGLATAIATAATTLAAAAPAIMIVAGMALAIYAGFKVLGSIFGKKKGQEGVERILNLIWAEARNCLNNLDNIKWILQDAKLTLWALADNLIPIADDIKHTLWDSTSLLQEIAKGGEMGGVEGLLDNIVQWTHETASNTWDTVNAIRDIPGLARGAIVKRPTLAKIAEHAPSIPELVAPLPEIEAAMSAAAARAADMARVEALQVKQAATTQAAIAKQEISVRMENKVDISGTVISDREYTRKRLMPEILEALRSPAYITRLIEELRRAGAGI